MLFTVSQNVKRLTNGYITLHLFAKY